MHPSILLALLTLLNPASSSSTTSRCRATPSSPDWPSLSTWSNLNANLSGRLIKPVPPAAVCYHDRPEFNAEKCREVWKSWETQEWHVEDPTSVMVNQWTGWSCLPVDLDAEDHTEGNTPQDPTLKPAEAQIPLPDSDQDHIKLELRSEQRTCSGRGYPAYVVNATTTQHIQTAITFAREHNIRLTIKNTGHDLPGRSTAPGSLSIWTHHLTNASYHPGPFILSGSGKQAEGDFIIAGSGCQNGQIQDLAHKHGRVFTGGGSRNVGIGGFVTGGGHSMLSPHYGLAADNVVQMEVVIPNGNVLTVNEDQHADLFWALRGGGGSTFGVVTSMVLRVHQDKPLERVSLFGVTEPDSQIAHELLPWGLSKTPFLMDNGISGYMFASHKIQSPIAVPGADDPHPIVGGFMVIGMLLDPQEEHAAEKAVQPMLEEARRRWGDKAQVFIDVQRYETFLDWYDVHHDQGPVGASTYIVSRLFDRATLEDETKLRRIIEPAVAPSWGLGAYMVAGEGVKNAAVAGGSNAVHPGWRDAMVLAMTWNAFASYDSAAGEKVVTELDEGWQAIRDEMPESGSYVNEGLTEEKNWQDSFWGANYDRLLSIKREIDPTDVFWCKPCVGYDSWTEVETEEGRQLCRVESD